MTDLLTTDIKHSSYRWYSEMDAFEIVSTGKLCGVMENEFSGFSFSFYSFNVVYFIICHSERNKME